jgi:hypothetical protein
MSDGRSRGATTTYRMDAGPVTIHRVLLEIVGELDRSVDVVRVISGRGWP